MTNSQCYQQLQYEERIAIASFQAQGLSIRVMARILIGTAANVNDVTQKSTASHHAGRADIKRRAAPSGLGRFDRFDFGLCHCLGALWQGS